MPTIHAQPYAVGQTGFEFETSEEFETKADDHPCEEFELEFLDGTPMEGAIFELADVAQHNLGHYFDSIELADFEQVQLAALLSVGVSLDDAIERRDSVSISEHESAADWALDYVDEMGGPETLPAETVATYFDYERFGRDAELGGDIIEMNFAGRRYFADAWSLER